MSEPLEPSEAALLAPLSPAEAPAAPPSGSGSASLEAPATEETEAEALAAPAPAALSAARSGEPRPAPFKAAPFKAAPFKAAPFKAAPLKTAPVLFLCLLAAGGLAAAGFVGNAADRIPLASSCGEAAEARKAAESALPRGRLGLEILQPAYAQSVAELVAARASVSELSAELSPERLALLEPEEAKKAARELIEAAKAGGMDPERALSAVLPRGGAVSALLATDRDRRDFLEAAARSDPAARRHAEAYAEIARLVPLMRSARDSYSLLLESAYEALAPRMAAPRAPQETGPIARRGEVYTPPKRGLDQAHPNALDIFFSRIERDPSGEIGPEILSVSRGIVLSVADDWKGGGGPSAYRSGGLSPNSGNGVIVYDPAARRYYSYFHLSRVYVSQGELVEKGKVLGRGGDTGANARKAGHGGHVHVEIFDASKDRALPALEIRDIIF